MYHTQRGQTSTAKESVRQVWPLNVPTLIPRPLGIEESAVFADELAVDGDLAALAEVADHVPMQAGLVRRAGFGVGGADGRVEGAADLLVEQRVLGILGDRVIASKGQLAKDAGAGVLVEHLD